MMSKSNQSPIPLPPSSVGRRGRIKQPDGKTREFVVIDEIRRRHSTAKDKTIVLCLERIQFLDTGQIELRPGYRILGMKAGRRGLWNWGQFAPFFPPSDYAYVNAQAKKKGWLTSNSRGGKHPPTSPRKSAH